MASQHNPSYYPVGAGEGHQDDPPAVDQLRPYSDIPSPSRTPDHTQGPPFDPNSLVEDGVPRPRFLGHASGARGSFASSFAVPSTFNDNDNSSSVYALNPLANRDSGRYSSVPYQDDPHDADLTAGAVSPGRRNRYLEEKRDTYAPPNKSKRKIIIGAIAVGVIIAAIAIVVALYFTVIKKNGKTSNGISNNDNGNNNDNNNNNNNNNGNNNNTSSNILKSGGDGSTIHLDNGTTITYSNPFGGTWYWDPEDPFNNNAQAQSWTPPLNQSFKWGTDRIFGVNLGGWLVTEPFISPSLFQKYESAATPAVDEWTLSQNMAADTASGGLNQLVNHYSTFITEQDFAEIAGAGLNFLRIPIPWWAIEVRDDEPFLARTCWTYFLKAIQWARKYGLRINVDLHAVPGSQNGWNHSGRLGNTNFLLGPMGYANAQRTLDYIRVIAEFISQPQYSDVVVLFGVLNEPRGSPLIGATQLEGFYKAVYDTIREASGLGEGKGPVISYHEGFQGLDHYSGFMTNADRIALDWHPYICFGGQSSNAITSYATTPCTTWGQTINQSMTNFGMTTAGEFSNAVTDCGLFLNNVGEGTRYEGTYSSGGPWPSQGSCTPWTDWQNWDQTMKDGTKQFALASMDALQNWFFWTWKIGPSSASGKVETPGWSYKLGLENGWMPKDPREASGVCGNTSPWTPPLKPWQTGGTGAGLNVQSNTLQWPPTSISSGGLVASLPSYTPTGTVVTLPGPTFTNSKGSTVKVDVGNGWENPSDSRSFYVTISGCSYLDPWVGPTATAPPVCKSGSSNKRAYPPPPQATPRP